MGKIWSIILAAGESKRMGFPKMLLNFNGKTMIEKVIDNIAESDSDSILVVLGAGREDLTDLVTKYDVNYCYNDNYKDGMLSSVQCGFRNLPSDTDAAAGFSGRSAFYYSSRYQYGNQCVQNIREGDCYSCLCRKKRSSAAD